MFPVLWCAADEQVASTCYSVYSMTACDGILVTFVACYVVPTMVAIPLMGFGGQPSCKGPLCLIHLIIYMGKSLPNLEIIDKITGTHTVHHMG